MTVLDELVQAATEAKCITNDPQYAAEVRHGLACSHYDSIGGGRWVHPECAVAAVLRALPESEAVVEAGAKMNATLDGSAIVLGHYRAEARRVILGIAKLADDE